jgi:hypothetical protein
MLVVLIFHGEGVLVKLALYKLIFRDLDFGIDVRILDRLSEFKILG